MGIGISVVDKIRENAKINHCKWGQHMQRIFSIFVLSAVLGLASLVAAPAAHAAGIQYKYDVLGRLIWVRYESGVTITYSYDAAGNRTQLVTSR